MRIALGVEYDGRGFSGWEVQREARTVQACLERALSRVADHPVRTICAGRTDAGVHALGQVVHFDSAAARTPRSWVFGANANLARDVSVLWATPVPEAFHARFSARRRRYCYVICNREVRPAVLHGRVAWQYRPLDERRMRAAAGHLLGEHDFSAFRARGCQARSPVRTVHALEVIRHGEMVHIEVCANAFLQHMVRNIAGVLMAVGAGRAEPDWAREVLEARDRTRGGVTAPAAGLYFLGAEYPGHPGIPRVSLPPALW